MQCSHLTPVCSLLATIVGEDASLGDLDNLIGSLIGGLNLLDQLECAHALDHTPENHILVVQECQGCTQGHIELSLIGVFKSIALAHTK